ncbi:MAG: hypothetical protein COW30_05510 [Rhodospirillales bacterium CG15_BIG_FIL_POST_REV_8_21_14_020_66_15]|nr:MAG: hypothetical protein COW30_05510 [Rhodospirillales bacterium CG15_BIG_FIL_POST_REV_8_21_14_020_66_15]
MRFALPVAALAVMLSSAAFTKAAWAADCMADPQAAIKAAEGEFKKAKGSLDKTATRGFNKAIDKAKMAAKTKMNDVACQSVANATGFLAPKK